MITEVEMEGCLEFLDVERGKEDFFLKFSEGVWFCDVVFFGF